MWLCHAFLVMDKIEFKTRRERIGMSQAQLADKLGMSISTISKYETGLNEVPKHFRYIFDSIEREHIKEIQSPVKSEESEKSE